MAKWTQFYNDEETLINDMLKTVSDENSAPFYKLVKGYAYIHSFKAYYNKNGKLTEKQITQLKRLSGEVYKNVYGIEAYFKKSGKQYQY